MRLVNHLKKQIAILLIAGSIFLSPNILSEVIIIPPSKDSQERLQEALILANPGDIIQLTTGIYNLEDSLSLDVDEVPFKVMVMKKQFLIFLIRNQVPRDSWLHLIRSY